MYWITKDGKKIKISEMTTQHIRHCLYMLERRNFDKDKYDALLQELNKRGVPFLSAYIKDSEVISKYAFEEY